MSRGTEALVFRGGVPADQRAVMRAPFQEGDLPGPVKYGYLNVGLVEAGPPDLLGRVVFCLYPHQTRYVVPAAAVVPVPDGVPAARAVLAGTVETAVNALWDAGPLVGDRVTVVGAGMVGCCVARLLAGIPGVDVQLVDVDPRAVGRRGGARRRVPAAGRRGDRPRPRACTPARPPQGCSGRWSCSRPTARSSSSAGTATGRSSCRSEARSTPAGSPSAPARSAPWRLRGAGTAPPATGSCWHWTCLQDPAFDAVVTGSSPFDDLPDVMSRLADGSLPALCHRIDYEAR